MERLRALAQNAQACAEVQVTDSHAGSPFSPYPLQQLMVIPARVPGAVAKGCWVSECVDSRIALWLEDDHGPVVPTAKAPLILE